MTKVVFVTGGARRVGLGITEHFLTRGWRVILHYRSSVRQAEQFSDHPSVDLYRADLTSDRERDDLIRSLRTTYDGLDGLVNNAAVFRRTSLKDLDRDEWDTHLDLNAWVPATLTRDLAGLLINRNGAIVNVLDWSTRRPYPAYLAYQASKGALETLTKGFARALAPEVRVNGVAPGPIEFPPDSTREHRQEILSQTLLEREGSREELAAAVFFLIEEATYTTGSVLDVDGGRHLT